MSDQGFGAGDQGGWTPPPTGGTPPPAGPPPSSFPPPSSPPPPTPAPGWQPPPAPGGWQAGAPAQPGGWQQQPQAWQPAAMPPPSSGGGCLKAFLITLGVVTVLGILGVVAAVVFAGKVVDEIDKKTGPAAASDYELEQESCTVSEFGSIEATGTIQNTSDKNQDFEIEYTFIDPKGIQLSVNQDYTETIAKGGTARYSVTSFASDVPQGSTCKLNGVSYTIFGD